MKIITISREFGSGGRELGKRLADALGVPCYDREIIKLIAEQNGFDESYVSHLSEKVIQVSYPMTIGRRFVTTNPVLEQQIKIISSQREILRQFAQKGDCVIVGRCADIILRDMKPMNIFVYADQQAKIDRCIANGKEGENLDPKVLAKKIKSIDKERAAYRELFTDTEWGDMRSYHLCVNTTGKEVKALVPGLVEYVNGWFEANK